MTNDYVINEITKAVVNRIFSERGVERRRLFERQGLCLMKDSYESYESFESDMYAQIEVMGEKIGLEIGVPEKAPVRLKRSLFDTQLTMAVIVNEESVLSLCSGLLTAIITMNAMDIDIAYYKKFFDDRMFNTLVIILAEYFDNIVELGTSYQNLLMMSATVLTTVDFNH